jgi:hypothetical protein
MSERGLRLFAQDVLPVLKPGPQRQLREQPMHRPSSRTISPIIAF